MLETKPPQSARILRIRKYPNRRYYDTTRSRHLTLDQIHSSICEGYEIEVTDSRSGADITIRVIAQIIIDLDPAKLAAFPAPLLHRLLRADDQLIQDFTQKYFNNALTAFLESQRKFEQSVRQALGLDAGATATVADWSRLMSASATQPGLLAAEQAALIEDLRRQVKDLQRQLSEAQQTKAKRR